MSLEQERKVLQLVAEALEHSPESRDAFLEQNIRNDSIGLAEAQSLLAFESRSGLLDARHSRETETLRGFMAGSIVGERFRVIRFIGRGGMGDVYEVEDLFPSSHPRVALKTIRPEIASNSRMAQQFEREIEIGKTITHANVCRIYDLGLHRDPPDKGVPRPPTMFLTMELLNGPTLAEHLHQKKAMQPSEALPILRQVAAALNAAHQAHVVHRDFKPGNVMLVAETEQSHVRAVVTDFGLAREVVDCSGPAQMTGAGAGTPDYMSPEQVKGDRIGPASDIYSLGVVAYQMVTGKLPFEGEHSLVRMVKRLHEPPVRPRASVPTLPLSWETAILHCLEREPENRFATTLDFIRRLGTGHLATEADVSAGPTDSRSIRARSGAVALFARSWRLALATMGVIALALWAFSMFLPGIKSPNPIQQHIAVLPFRNLGATAVNDAFCEGLSESLTSKLSQMQQFQKALWIVPASETQKLQTPTEAARRVRANLVVNGAVQQIRNSLKVTTNLVDADTMRVIASRTIDTQTNDLVTLQDDVWERVADMLQLQIQPAARNLLTSDGTRVPGAFEFYEQGLGYLARYSIENLDRAIDLFSKAVALDPLYAGAYAGLGEAYSKKYEVTKDPKYVALVSENARKAVNLNDKLGQVHIATGQMYYRTGRYEEAIRELKRSLELAARV